MAPLAVTAAAVASEQYESVLVSVNHVTVTATSGSGEWTVMDGTGNALCDDTNDYLYFPKTGDSLDSVTGVVNYTFNAFKIQPRKTVDIRGAMLPHYALGGTIIAMNDSFEITAPGYVEISGDTIAGISASPPPDIPVIETGGLIFPGLVDAHDHPSYDTLDLIPFPGIYTGSTPPVDITSCMLPAYGPFTDRYVWQSLELMTDFRAQLGSMADFGGTGALKPTMIKLVEARALAAGTTTIHLNSAHKYTPQRSASLKNTPTL
jgi:hypothetical protein